MQNAFAVRPHMRAQCSKRPTRPRQCRRSRTLGWTDVLPRPFTWADGHIRAELPHGHALFSARHGGVSEGPYESLNLGLLTDDDPACVSENRRRLAAAVGVGRERFLYGRQ